MGRLRTLRRVSRMRMVVWESLAVRFQMDTMSSWKRMDTTAPHTSSPTMNCSPRMARIRFSQQREARPLRRRTIHLPPVRFASSSHMGLMPSLKRW
uniref:Putative secreted protein n=1 Tax=Ixodes ricinus TaxID=34613 RepID=A0A6B0U690_IXORI